MSDCHVIQGWFAFLIQAILGSLCILTLVIKRQTEVPRRDWMVWSFDALKQSIGSSFAHFANLFLSVLVLNAANQIEDECLWYCLSYLVDSSFGITLNLIMLSGVEYITARDPKCSHLKFGDYIDARTGKPSIRYFLLQLSIWLAIVITSKIITYTTQLTFARELSSVMNFLLSWLSDNPRAELVVVMIIIPVIINTLQFWLTDMFLKHDDSAAVLLENRMEHNDPLASPRGPSTFRNRLGKGRKPSIDGRIEISSSSGCRKNGSSLQMVDFDADLDQGLLEAERDGTPRSEECDGVETGSSTDLRSSFKPRSGSLISLAQSSSQSSGSNGGYSRVPPRGVDCEEGDWGCGDDEGKVWSSSRLIGMGKLHRSPEHDQSFMGFPPAAASASGTSSTGSRLRTLKHTSAT